MRVAFGFVGLLATVVILCVLAVVVFKRVSRVETPASHNTAGVTQDEVKDEIRDTVGAAYGH
jgi:hypothetical protein